MAEAHRTPGQTVAARVKELREARGLSQRWLGELMVRLGYRWGDTIVSRVERSEREVTVDELMGLALALGTHPAALLAADAPGVAIGKHLVPADTLNEWVRGGFRMGLNPDGSRLTKIFEIGRAIDTTGSEHWR